MRVNKRGSLVTCSSFEVSEFQFRRRDNLHIFVALAPKNVVVIALNIYSNYPSETFIHSLGMTLSNYCEFVHQRETVVHSPM